MLAAGLEHALHRDLGRALAESAQVAYLAELFRARVRGARHDALGLSVARPGEAALHAAEPPAAGPDLRTRSERMSITYVIAPISDGRAWRTQVVRVDDVVGIGP